MTLKELRLKNKAENKIFTQSYCAIALGVTLKSYIMYEEKTMGLSADKKVKLVQLLGEDFE